MEARLGKTFYRTAATIAVVIMVLVVCSYVYNNNRGEPLMPIFPVLLAGVIWLLGRVCRHISPG